MLDGAVCSVAHFLSASVIGRDGGEGVAERLADREDAASRLEPGLQEVRARERVVGAVSTMWPMAWAFSCMSALTS